MDSLRGATIRWMFVEPPVAGMKFEHTFREDGTLVWRVLEGPGKGASKEEKRYATIKIADGVHAVSYLAASGHTLSVVVAFPTGRVVGFGSDNKEWHPLTGTLLD
jgi:molybdenum cofactor biosynthesis MoaF-like protein